MFFVLCVSICLTFLELSGGQVWVDFSVRAQGTQYPGMLGGCGVGEGLQEQG